ncbi:hypothetical protein [Roseobacter sinensis]|uniref:Lipoprotein n=1 Tax=Roseobacter sinensis TaxID=2931391 RepID=A0ABT3BFK8_9RHOB|nr:hypothetical protein [Roseobacter sp. WL0113]MCV3272169.1 hypothetical protein [Roseobacter sp. WL0113]
MIRGVAVLVCVTAIGACTGQSGQRALETPVAKDAETDAGVRVSGYATFGYIKGH